MHLFAHVLLNFKGFQKVHIQTPRILPHPQTIRITPFHTKNNILKVSVLIKTIIQTLNKHSCYHKRVLRNKIFPMISVLFNQINKYTVKTHTHDFTHLIKNKMSICK